MRYGQHTKVLGIAGLNLPSINAKRPPVLLPQIKSKYFHGPGRAGKRCFVFCCSSYCKRKNLRIRASESPRTPPPSTRRGPSLSIPICVDLPSRAGATLGEAHHAGLLSIIFVGALLASIHCPTHKYTRILRLERVCDLEYNADADVDWLRDGFGIELGDLGHEKRTVPQQPINRLCNHTEEKV